MKNIRIILLTICFLVGIIAAIVFLIKDFSFIPILMFITLIMTFIIGGDETIQNKNLRQILLTTRYFSLSVLVLIVGALLLFVVGCSIANCQIDL